MIARGNGRSYGDAAINRNATLLMRSSDRILAFDADRGVVTCESGILLAEIIDLILPRGWFVPVTPGTKFVTLGGMIAADVHGKNHHLAGSFANHVVSMDVALADGRVQRCGRDENAELFAATCGGMGLTGIILAASIRLIAIETAMIRQETLRARNLTEVMRLFEDSTDWTYSVAWIDCLARGDGLGRSLLYRGEHARAGESPRAKGELAAVRKRTCRVPFDFPAVALNRWSVGAFNEVYFRSGRRGIRFLDCDAFFFPLDALLDWNRLYGRTGFVQYQCVLPKTASPAGLTALLDRIANSRQGSFLAVLKLLGKAGDALLSFPMEGYTLALDFRVSPETFSLLIELDAIVADHGGRLYLAKDARMGAGMLRGYARLDAFRALRQQFDPTGKFSSLQSQRLGL